ncbi:MAG: exodeoxyribonuclease VII large subunit [Dehalococcoidia bacterium]|nr:exodeoxyribonuclease VII large subunit [Dehalococcoidia bacterium]
MSPPAADAGALGEVYPVGEVTRYLRELLEGNRHLTAIWVAGEVSNCNRSSAGHIYFTLKDARVALRCAFFRNRNVGQREWLVDGASVVVHGSLSVYEQRGELSFIVDFVQPEGTGALAAEFERRRARFEAEGLFDPQRKRSLPRFPQRVGVVTSPTGAVFHDIAQVLARRWPLATLLLQPTPVQGADAAPAIAQSLRALARSHRPDVIIVARGGGAAEDLWAFNEEPVVRAIFASPVPVVSAVGHETDTTLADLVADLRASTPSSAAELVAPDRADVARALEARAQRAEARVLRALVAARDRLDLRVAALHDALPDLEGRRRVVRSHEVALLRGAATAVAAARVRVAGAAGRLGALSPLATLDRGFAIVERPDGTAVGSAAALRAGERVELRLRDGRRAARIEPDRAEPRR